MDIWFLILCVVGLFLGMMFFRRWHDYPLLVTFAIGFAVNAHFYHSFSYPSYIPGCPIPFGFNAFLYVGFMYAAVLTALEYSVRRSKILTSSTCAAILMAAIVQFMANVSIKGFNWEDTAVMLFFLISGFGSFIAVMLIGFVFRKMKERNTNTILNMSICVSCGTIIHGLFFFAGAALVYNTNWEAFWWNILGYVIEAALAVILGLGMFWLNTNVWIPRGLESKYTEIWKRNK